MKILDLKNGRILKKINEPLCLFLGNFDGVHVGHAKLVDVALEEGKKLGIKVGAWTFSDHPLNAVKCGKGILTLVDNEEKNRIFSEKNVDYIIYEDFLKVKDYSPEAFISEILIGKFDCRCAVCGFNFKFGKNGEGTPETLKKTMEEFGRYAVIVSPVLRMNKTVSSTEIRSYIENGQLEEAAVMLGRPYSINFPVVHGNQLGRTIGIPTINQRFPENHIRLKNGIYASKCYVGGKEYLGVSNIGSRPTVNSDECDINCETHIIGYDGWLYGKNVKVCFYKRLRDEVCFEDISELKEAVENDIQNVIALFGREKNNDE